MWYDIIKVLKESDDLLSVIEVFAFPIAVSLISFILTPRLNLGTDCTGAGKYVIEDINGQGL